MEASYKRWMTRKNRLCLLLLVLSFLFCGCKDSQNKQMSAFEQTKYDKAAARLHAIYAEAEDIAKTKSVDEWSRLKEEIRLLNYDYNGENMSEDGKLRCQKLKDSIKAVRQNPEIVFKGKDGKAPVPQVATREVFCKPTDSLAHPVEVLTTKKVFDEPKKIGLRAQIKAYFSGKARSLVAIPVPKDCYALLYSLRVSNNEKSVPTDGKFADRLSASYKSVRLLGVKVYEKESGSGIIDKMLFNTRPPREDDAFCNLYVFDNSKQAKKFQDGTEGSGKYAYDVDLSQMGTQSCNGRLKINGQNVIYMGFENERMRYDTYIWLEVVALKRTTKYMRPIYL